VLLAGIVTQAEETSQYPQNCFNLSVSARIISLALTNCFLPSNPNETKNILQEILPFFCVSRKDP
jgi:hypothetical protein